MIVHSYKEQVQRDHAFDNTMGHWPHKQKIDLTGGAPFEIKLKNYDEDLDLVGAVGAASVNFPYLIVAWS